MVFNEKTSWSKRKPRLLVTKRRVFSKCRDLCNLSQMCVVIKPIKWILKLFIHSCSASTVPDLFCLYYISDNKMIWYALLSVCHRLSTDGRWNNTYGQAELSQVSQHSHTWSLILITILHFIKHSTYCHL